MKRIREKIWAQIFIIYTRYAMGASLVFASVIKIKGNRFTTLSGAEEPIDSAWHFFETMYQSGVYWKFIGLSQLIAGLLLMTQRFSKLGALISLPILINIFIITLSYYFSYTPVITGLLLAANILLIIWDWDTFRVLVDQPSKGAVKTDLEKSPIWTLAGLSLFTFTFFYRIFIDTYNGIFWATICIFISAAGLFVWLGKSYLLKNHQKS